MLQTMVDVGPVAGGRTRDQRDLQAGGSLPALRRSAPLIVSSLAEGMDVSGWFRPASPCGFLSSSWRSAAAAFAAIRRIWA